jgi:uncharacterized protein YndB with AHSA1/START domain
MDSYTHVQERELRLTRRIPAPPEAVFAAWTQAEHLKAWFGPYGMTVPEAEVDLRPGGMHRTLMRDAAGKEYPNRLAIDEVDAPRRLVLRVVDEACGPLVGTTITLLSLPEAGGTRLEVICRHPTAEMRATHLEMGFVKGWERDARQAHLACHRPGQPAPEGCPLGGAPSPAAWLAAPHARRVDHVDPNARWGPTSRR